MKRLLIALSFICGMAAVSHADWLGDSKEIMTVHYSTAVAATTTSTSTIFIDLSDVTNYPHKETRELYLQDIYIRIDKVASSTGTVRLGVVNMVNSSTGSVTWFRTTSSLLNVSNTRVIDAENNEPSYIRARVNSNGLNTDGSTPYILSSDKTSGSTTYQNDVNLYTVSGAQVTPAQGDIIVEIVKDGTNAWNVAVSAQYKADN